MKHTSAVRRFSNLLMGVALVTTLAAAQAPDVKAVSDPIYKLRMEGYTKQRNHEAVDWASINAQMKALAKESLKSIDPATLPSEQAGDWAPLFEIAGRNADAVALGERSVEFYGVKAWMAQSSLLSTYLADGNKSKILDTLDSLVSLNARMVGQVGEFVRMGITEKYAKSDPKFVLQCYDLLLKRVDLTIPRSAGDQSWSLFAYGVMSANRDKLLYETGQKSLALADLSKVRKTVANDARALVAVDETYKQFTLPSQIAPEIEASRQIGTFTSLQTLRGKVVLLDFFAHWCGPCKAAFPDMKALYGELHSKGVEIVGVTNFYGYYESKQGIKVDEEFGLVKNTFIPQFGLPWPVIFEKDRAASKAYGVSGIPQLVVIDKAGKIRKIEVGYTKAGFAETKQLVSKLLAEK